MGLPRRFPSAGEKLFGKKTGRQGGEGRGSTCGWGGKVWKPCILRLRVFLLGERSRSIGEEKWRETKELWEKEKLRLLGRGASGNRRV